MDTIVAHRREDVNLRRSTPLTHRIDPSRDLPPTTGASQTEALTPPFDAVQSYVVMAAKAERLEARLTSTQRKQIEQAAALAGESVSSFVVLAALDRADVLVRERASTVVPASYFDQLLRSLDDADEAPRLALAAARAKRRSRIAPA
jgi:uncharacterized protein (DUF1778 family)